MNFWNKTPLFRLVFPFIIGILTGYSFEVKPKVVGIAIALFSLLFILSFFLKKIYSAYAFRVYFGGLIHLLLFLFGYWLTLLETDTSREFFLKNTNKPAYYLCTLLKPLKETEKSFGAEVEIYARKQESSWIKASAKTLLYLKKDTCRKLPRYGDCILIHTAFNEIAGPQNPNELNYKKLAGLNGFHYRAFLKTHDWKILPFRKNNYIKQWAFELRAALFNILKKHLPNKKEYGVAEALIAGGMEDIDKGLSNAYSAAGVIHVLSVSGLHIGLVYMVLNALLFFMNGNKILQSIKCIILIAFLWFYAILSGFSPSVLRAAMMLSLVIYGRRIGSSTNSYNTLAASAFLLLLFSPLLIFNLGFQLSYLAVTGILVLHPILYKQWVFRHYLIDKILQLVSVSLAAQVFTFPIILYHFHQLPNYFILANLIVIPLATLILFSGIALVLVLKCTWLCNIIATCMHYFLKCMNYTVQQIETLPYALTKNSTISFWDMLALYMCLVFLLLFYFSKSVSLLCGGLCFLLIFQASQAYAAFETSHQKKIIVYSLSKLQAIDFIDRNKALLLGDSEITNNRSKFLFHIQASRFAQHITKTEIIQIPKKGFCYKRQNLLLLNNCIRFYKTRIYLANGASTAMLPASGKKIFVDFIIINDSYKGTISDLLKSYSSPLIILGTSMSILENLKREHECNLIGVHFYSIARQGAFQKTI